jgi:hypothetical protein
VNVKRNSYIHSEYLPFLDANDELIEVLRTSHRKRAGLYAAGGDGKEIDKLLQPTDAAELLVLIEEIQGLGLDIRALAERYFDNRTPTD